MVAVLQYEHVPRKSSPAGVPPDIMGTGPVVAIPRALAPAGICVIELNEAFAVQALAVIRLAKLDPERVNPNGGDAQFGTVTMCLGGGPGAAGIFERV